MGGADAGGVGVTGAVAERATLCSAKAIEGMSMTMVEAGTYTTRSDAEVAQAALAAAGIPSVISADDAGGAYPFDLTGGARLLVDEADAEDARAVLSVTRK
jgi:hypothetical protein